MIEYRLNEIFPRFLLADRNGLAMAKAISAALDYFLERCEAGLTILQDVERMPEWRLDELAWELNCLYDYGADIEVKRGWIRDAYKNYRLHGTAEGVRQYLRTYFDECAIFEWFEFEGGEPGQFNIEVSGDNTTENENWIRQAVERAKNIRSTLNTITFNGGNVEVPVNLSAKVFAIEIREKARVFISEGNYVYEWEQMYVGDLQEMNVGELEQ